MDVTGAVAALLLFAGDGAVAAQDFMVAPLQDTVFREWPSHAGKIADGSTSRHKGLARVRRPLMDIDCFNDGGLQYFACAPAAAAVLAGHR